MTCRGAEHALDTVRTKVRLRNLGAERDFMPCEFLYLAESIKHELPIFPLAQDAKYSCGT